MPGSHLKANRKKEMQKAKDEIGQPVGIFYLIITGEQKERSAGHKAGAENKILHKENANASIATIYSLLSG